MLIFKWDSSLELGIPLIDGQHKKIIESANAFFISHKCGDSNSRLLELLDFLTHYVLYHFQAEEAFQVQCRYPEYRSHQATHKMLQTQVKFHATKLSDNGFCKDDIERFYQFLRDWIVNHILTDDTKFVRYFKDAGM